MGPTREILGANMGMVLGSIVGHRQPFPSNV